jgi:hypothetical protein
MPDGFQLPTDLVTDTRLFDPGDLDTDALARSGQLLRLRRRVEESQAKVRLHQDRLNELYEEIVRADIDAAGLQRLADEAVEKERSVAEQFLPEMEALREKLKSYPEAFSPDARQYFVEALNIGQAWITAWLKLHERLIKLAAERSAAGRRTLRAKPVKGEVDRAALTDKIITRFPNILKALAE